MLLNTYMYMYFMHRALRYQMVRLFHRIFPLNLLKQFSFPRLDGDRS